MTEAQTAENHGDEEIFYEEMEIFYDEYIHQVRPEPTHKIH